MPPFQKKGLGSKMYEQIFRYYNESPTCFQIIVEDSAEDFQKI
jgi:hypothetical protein